MSPTTARLGFQQDVYGHRLQKGIKHARGWVFHVFGTYSLRQSLWLDPTCLARIPCLPQLKEMLAQGGKVRDSRSISAISVIFSGTFLKCPWEYEMFRPMKATWGWIKTLWNTIVFGHDHPFAIEMFTRVKTRVLTHSHFTVSRCFQIVWRPKSALLQLRLRRRVWRKSLQLQRTGIWTWQKWPWRSKLETRETDRTCLFLVSCIRSNCIQFWPPILRCYQMASDRQCITQKWVP